MWLVISIIFIIFNHAYNFLFPQYLYFKFDILLSKFLFENIMNEILEIPNHIYEKYEHGKLFNILIYDSSTCSEIINQQVVEITASVCSIIIFIIAMYFVSPQILVISIALVPLYMLSIFFNKNKLEKLQSLQTNNFDKFVDFTKYVIANKKQINILHYEKYIYGKFLHKVDSWIKFRLKYWFWYFLSSETPSAITALIKNVTLFMGALLILQHKLTIGSLIVSLNYIDFLINPFNRIAEIIIRRNSNKISFERFDDLVSCGNKDEIYAQNLTLDCGFLEFKNVNILNRDNTTLFYIDDLNIKENGIYILSGENGAGKSSFLNLILNISNMNLACKSSSNSIISLNKNILEDTFYLSYPHLFIEDTVKENILINAKENEDFETIIELLKIEDLDKIITFNPINLSLGQQQKISLARIFLSNKKFFVLDEPLTNLDQETCNKVVSYLKTIKNDKIIIIVTHDEILKCIGDYHIEIKDKKLINSTYSKE